MPDQNLRIDTSSSQVAEDQDSTDSLYLRERSTLLKSLSLVQDAEDVALPAHFRSWGGHANFFLATHCPAIHRGGWRH